VVESNDPKDSAMILTMHGFAYAVNEIHVGSVSARSDIRQLSG